MVFFVYKKYQYSTFPELMLNDLKIGHYMEQIYFCFGFCVQSKWKCTRTENVWNNLFWSDLSSKIYWNSHFLNITWIKILLIENSKNIASDNISENILNKKLTQLWRRKITNTERILIEKIWIKSETESNLNKKKRSQTDRHTHTKTQVTLFLS